MMLTHRTTRLGQTARFAAGLSVLLLAALAGAQTSDAGGLEESSDKAPAFRDPDLPVAQRVADLISRLTLEEKAAQMEVLAPAIGRLGVPAFQWWSEGIHGMARAGRATMFPQAIAQAATWEPALLERIAAAVALEARAKYDVEGKRFHGVSIWAPSINMTRDPRWGRVEENYGEDPHLAGQLGMAFVRGLQGDHPVYLKTVAAPKHFAVHSSETDRAKSSFDVSERLLREYYLPAFRACIVDAGTASIMTAFSGINSVPCTANRWLATDLLRGEWGFDGAVVTDWGAVRRLRDSHRFVATDEAAVAATLAAGVDVLCDPVPLTEAIVKAVREGLVTEGDLDRALARSLTLRFRLGMFDPPRRVPWSRVAASVVGRNEHLELALEAACKSIVLLKNGPVPRGYGFQRLLPLDSRNLRSVAVLGPYAEVAQLGAYSGDPAGKAVTPLEGIRAHLPLRVVVRTAGWEDTQAALQAALECDVVVAVLGLNNKIEREGNDRKTLALPREQQEFIEKIVQVNPATVVVLMGGSPVAIGWIDEHVPAVLAVWYPGEQGGTALGRTLIGANNPAARLPITFYAADEDLPPIEDYDITRGRTYMYLDQPALYPFGHGLSYSRFEYADLHAVPAAIAADAQVTIRFTLSNQGPLAGDEVAQLYVRHVDPPVPMPRRQLKAFTRVHLPASQSQQVQWTLPASELAYWDAAQQRFVVPAGEVELLIGASSQDIRLRETIRVRLDNSATR